MVKPKGCVYVARGRAPEQQVRGREYIKKIDTLGDMSSTTSRRYSV
jgi:hypothetical protein